MINTEISLAVHLFKLTFRRPERPTSSEPIATYRLIDDVAS